MVAFHGHPITLMMESGVTGVGMSQIYGIAPGVIVEMKEKS